MNTNRFIGTRRFDGARRPRGRTIPAARPRAFASAAEVGAGRTVCARFTPSEIPILTSTPHKTALIRAAARTLAALGRAYLGGHVEVTSDAVSPRGCPRAATECLAAARAVENAMGGGCGTVRLPLPDGWSGSIGCPERAGCWCRTESGVGPDTHEYGAE